jgi:hypothetical protein
LIGRRVKNVSVTACNKPGKGIMRKFGDIRHEVKKAYRRLGNWRAVGKEMGITGGMAFRIGMRKYEPKEAKIRARLGLPAFGRAPVCAECGEVHVAKRCPEGKAKKMTRIWDLPVNELRRRFLEREEF